MQRGYAVARKGRKRKTGYRHPGGQLVKKPKREPTVDTTIISMRQPHRQGVEEGLRHDQRAECQLGILTLNKLISGAQYRAGRRYARIVSRYLASIQAPSPNPPSIAGIMEPRSGFGGHLPDAIARERKIEYDAAFEYLGRTGQKPQRIVARVAVQDHPCPIEEIDNLRKGLSKLDEHFMLMDRVK